MKRTQHRRLEYRSGYRRAIGIAWMIAVVDLLAPAPATANPYLAKPGEAPVTVRVATCAVSGGFIHLYSALDNGLFDKYGIRVNPVYIRGSGISLAALSSDEVQFLYCAADATIPGMATGIDGKLIGAPGHGDLSFRLSRAVHSRFNLTEEAVEVRPSGGGHSERYHAMVQDLIQ